MALASTSVHVVEWAPQMPDASVCIQGLFQLLPSSPGDSPRSAGRSDSSSFLSIAYALGLRACEILCAPFKSGVSVSHSAPELLKVGSTGLQGQTFWRLTFLVQIPRSLGTSSATVTILPFVNHPPWGILGFCLSYSSSLWLLLYIFSCRRSFLVGSGLCRQLSFCK